MQKETRRNSAAGSAKPNPPRKLTRAEKKQIAEIIRQAKGDGKAHTAQQTIPYIQMYPDGICKVTGRKYSKTVAFEDINYQLAQADDKTAIFENWCDFLNYFDASVSVQLSFINQGTQRGEAEKAVNIPSQEDAFNSIRTEYRDMLKNQLAKGNNGLVKAKYITFAIEADSLGAAKSRLARIETDVLNNFKLLGVSARPMTGYERLKMLHGIFHPEGGQFSFDFSWLAPSGLSTKDFIAPSSFRFGEGRYFRMGRKIGAVSAVKKGNLLSIGALSKQTGVHIKSLRYYDSLGILRPAYIDPSSGYRYYSLQQIPVVDAIQLCINLDIPLKQFTDYCMDGGSQIHYGKLIERGTILAKAKIQAIQERLTKLDKMRSEIEHSELIQKSDGMVRCGFSPMNFLLAPYPENDTEMKVLALFHSLVRTAESSGLTISHFAGRLLHCHGSQRELLFYLDVSIPEGVQNLPENLLQLPAGEYLCCKQAAPAIENAANIFAEQFTQDYEKYVIESELSLGDYDCAAPPFELCCSLPNDLAP